MIRKEFICPFMGFVFSPDKRLIVVKWVINTGVTSSNLTRVTIKTPVARKARFASSIGMNDSQGIHLPLHGFCF